MSQDDTDFVQPTTSNRALTLSSDEGRLCDDRVCLVLDRSGVSDCSSTLSADSPLEDSRVDARSDVIGSVDNLYEI